MLDSITYTVAEFKNLNLEEELKKGFEEMMGVTSEERDAVEFQELVAAAAPADRTNLQDPCNIVLGLVHEKHRLKVMQNQKRINREMAKLKKDYAKALKSVPKRKVETPHKIYYFQE